MHGRPLPNGGSRSSLSQCNNFGGTRHGLQRKKCTVRPRESTCQSTTTNVITAYNGHLASPLIKVPRTKDIEMTPSEAHDNLRMLTPSLDWRRL